MDVKERILTIRLMEKVEACAAYAERLGIEVESHSLCVKLPTDSEAAGQMP